MLYLVKTAPLVYNADVLRPALEEGGPLFNGSCLLGDLYTFSYVWKKTLMDLHKSSDDPDRLLAESLLNELGVAVKIERFDSGQPFKTFHKVK